MIGKMTAACSTRGIPCCATIGVQHLTESNVQLLLESGLKAICVEPASVRVAAGLVLMAGKSKPAEKSPGDSGNDENDIVVDGQQEWQKKTNNLIQFDSDPSFS
jgi:hypothetical protein